MPSSVNVPGVDEQRDPLARRQLAGRVLARDPLLPAAEPRQRAPLVQVLGERAHAAGGFRFGAHAHAQRPVQTGSRFSKNAFTPSWMSSVENASESLGLEVLERVGQRHVLLAVDRVLAEPHQQRRLGRQACRPLAHDGVELVRRDHAVDDPDRSASAAEICSPSSSSSLVFLRPTLR